MDKPCLLHRKTLVNSEKSQSELRPNDVEWCYRVDKTELSIVWADSSTGKDWDKNRQIILDRITAGFTEAPLRYRNGGTSSDALYLRYANYESEYPYNVTYGTFKTSSMHLFLCDR